MCLYVNERVGLPIQFDFMQAENVHRCQVDTYVYIAMLDRK